MATKAEPRSRYDHSDMTDAEKLALVRQVEKRRKEFPLESLDSALRGIGDARINQSRFYMWRGQAVSRGELKPLPFHGGRKSNGEAKRKKENGAVISTTSLDLAPLQAAFPQKKTTVTKAKPVKHDIVMDFIPAREDKRAALGDLFDALSRLIK